jgi:hypothetical protein
MVFEQLDEALANNSGSAKNSDWDFMLRHFRVENSSYITSEQGQEIAPKLPTVLFVSSQIQCRHNLLRNLLRRFSLGVYD